MKRIIHKINNIYLKSKTHPLAKNTKGYTIFKYIYFNIYASIFKDFRFTWFNKLNIITSKGDAGMIANYYFGLYEPDDSLFILNHNDANDILLDVGANVGHYSLLCSGILKMKVIAIEPIAYSLNKLKLNAKNNNIDTIIYINNGVSNEETQLRFSNDKGVMNHVVNDNYKNYDIIKVLTIDQILSQFDYCPTIMKIDVEGHELFALQGAKKLLSNPNLNVILIELNWMLDSKQTENEIIKLIRDFNFKPYQYNVDENKLIELDYKNEKQFNTIFIRDIELASNKLLNKIMS